MFWLEVGTLMGSVVSKFAGSSRYPWREGLAAIRGIDSKKGLSWTYVQVFQTRLLVHG